MNINSVNTIARCFCALSLPILLFAKSLKYLTMASPTYCSFEGTIVNFLVVSNARTIKISIDAHIVISVSTLNETLLPKIVAVYTQCSIDLPSTNLYYYRKFFFAND